MIDASTAARMFDNVNNLFDQYNIQWNHCMGKGSENLSAYIGKRISISISQKQAVIKLIEKKDSQDSNCP